MVLAGIATSYETLLLHNATRISSVESSLRSLTWFLPGRFQDSELASEALYSALNVLGMYHDSILVRTINSLPASQRPTPSSHTRYTKHFTTVSPLYRHLSRILSLLNYTELLLEMGVRKRRGSKRAEDLVIGIEGLKAVLRLVLVGATKGRTGVTPPVPEREIDPSVLDLHKPKIVIDRTTEEERIDILPTADGKLGEEDTWTGKRTGFERPTLKSLRGDESEEVDGAEKVKQFLQSRVLTVEHAKRPEDLVGRAKGLGKLAEIIWILRPLIYVLLMKKYGRRHTLPYLLSLSLEYLAYSLRTAAEARKSQTKASGPMLAASSRIGEAESQETTRRGRAFWWYLLRGPVWESWTKSPQLQALSSRFEDKPLVGMVSTVIGDYLPLVDDYYFYTS